MDEDDLMHLGLVDDDEIILDEAALVLALLDRPLLDAATQQALVERAGGNPLYAEEFVRMLQAGAGVGERLPETLRARLETLEKKLSE